MAGASETAFTLVATRRPWRAKYICDERCHAEEAHAEMFRAIRFVPRQRGVVTWRSFELWRRRSECCKSSTSVRYTG